MNKTILYPAGNSSAIRWACQFLSNDLIIRDEPASDITHLLLPIPSFEADGRIKGGGVLEHILADLPEDITIIGGNLEHPAVHGYKTLDLLQDGAYMAENAAITADCAMRVAASEMPMVFRDCPMLIIGWGRIGKQLASLLKSIGAQVTVAARKKADRDMLRALGYGAVTTNIPSARDFRVVFNTIPAPVLSEWGGKRTIKIELASQKGLSGSDVIQAKGLPGKMAPESSGKLIAQTVIRLLKEREVPA